MGWFRQKEEARRGPEYRLSDIWGGSCMVPQLVKLVGRLEGGRELHKAQALTLSETLNGLLVLWNRTKEPLSLRDLEGMSLEVAEDLDSWLNSLDHGELQSDDVDLDWLAVVRQVQRMSRKAKMFTEAVVQTSQEAIWGL